MIARVETFVVNYPVVGQFKFFAAVRGRPPGRPSVVVKLTDDSGAVGWGEAAPSPRWSYETIETVRTTIDRYLAPELIGQDAQDAERLHDRMNRAIAPSFSTGQPIAKSGVDLALFDLSGKLLGESAKERWRRDDCGDIELSWTLNASSLDEVEPSIAQAHACGYRHFNVKVGPDLAYDVEMCKLIRRFAPEAVVWVDANGGYDEATALEAAHCFAELGFLAFEQPVAANRLSSFARLKRQGALPIVMDEGIVSVVELEEFHRLGLLDGVAIKVARCGGLGEALRQVEFLEQNGLLFMASGLTDPDLALSASLLLFGACGLSLPAALNGPQFLADSILESPLRVEQGRIRVPDGSGLGVTVDEARLKRLCVESG